jgi:hypothetical protein
MSRHQLQPTCAATAICANVLRLWSAASHVNDYRKLRSRRPNVTTRTVNPVINATTPAPATTQPLAPLLASGDITVAVIAQIPSAVATVATTTIHEPPGAPTFMAETYHCSASRTLKEKSCRRHL